MAYRIPPLRAGHELHLLEGARELFPAMLAAIDGARSEVLLETYIFDFTGEGAEIAYALERAASRGVTVRVVADAVGSGESPPAWLHRLSHAGVAWRWYSPTGWLGLMSLRQWRRLHRKLCVVDATIGFCGGINILDDFHDPNHGALDAPRFDFALRAAGPLVAEMHDTMQQLWLRLEAASRLRHAQLTGALVSLRAARARTGPGSRAAPWRAGSSRAKAALVLRDNVRNRGRIERAYRRAIGQAREEIIIANAYFVPGRKLRHALVSAAKRGVRVSLLLQGRYEYFMQYYAARPVLGAMLHAGVEIFEYAPSFLHAKVAVVDGRWATVGSSNLDPLSLLLAREANVMVEDAAFAQRLRQRLLRAMRDDGTRLDAAAYESRSGWMRAKEWLALVVMRVALFVQGKRYL
ncbi:cardiolipin synthase ClsB [Ramlibacter sp.]|uniref:cardiolipin synthase ClsB n=1 Tax=Ramlibacter sp. TaxID=1917967 RepID=UPI003D121402